MVVGGSLEPTMAPRPRTIVKTFGYCSIDGDDDPLEVERQSEILAEQSVSSIETTAPLPAVEAKIGGILHLPIQVF
jgi:hypothetical protein